MNERSGLLSIGTRALLALAAALILAACAGPAAESGAAKPQAAAKVWIGMNLGELRAAYPDLAASPDSNERFIRPATEHGLRGEWTYSFTDNKLNWFIFNASETTISQESFDVCLGASTDIIDSYKELFGQPARYRVGIPEFNDPALKPHNGYLVQQAVWETPAGRIKVDFTFLGENHSYEFLVSTQISN